MILRKLFLFLVGNLLKKKFVRNVLFPVLCGICLGLIVGRLYTDSGNTEEIHKHVYVRRVHLDEYAYPDGSIFFLRCLVLLHPDSKKPLSFIMAIRDTYGYQCNQTIFYTTSEEIYKKVGDQHVFLVQSNSNAFYWNFFQMALNHSSTIPAMWTVVLDEQVFLKVSNLRRVLMNFYFKEKLILGRVIESQISHVFPWFSNTRLSLQAGIVFSHSALRALLTCNDFLLGRTTEKALMECSNGLKIPVIDPVDEENMHLFNYRDFKTLVPLGKDGDHLCCSDHAISFGQQSFKEIRMAHYASENWGVFGVNGVVEVNTTYAIDRGLLVRTTPNPIKPTKKLPPPPPPPPPKKNNKGGLL